MAETIAVIIAIGERRDSIGRAVASVLANETPKFDLYVVDRDPARGRPTCLDRFEANPTLRYLESTAWPSTAAHNLAIAHTRSPYVAVTDDDCEVAQNWLPEIKAAFDSNPQIGVVFGNVLPAERDPTVGISPAYNRERPYLARSVREKAAVEGIWASMAVRREVWERIGGFDELLGAGAKFPGSADSDFALRSLAAGSFVYETPAASVVHHRVTPLGERKRGAYTYSRGAGAMMAKHLKCRTPGTLRLVSTLVRRWVSGSSHTALSLGGESTRGARIAGFGYGFFAGLVTRVDRRNRRFRT